MITKNIQGYLSRLQGASFEEMIDCACEYYSKEEKAYIKKTPEPMKIIKPANTERTLFIAAFQKKAQADYKGVLNNGKGIHFEAKSTKGDTILQSVVNDEQAKDLSMTSKMGGECFVLVSLVCKNKFYKVPWSVWTNMKELFGHKYMNEKDLAPYEIQMKIYGPAFLPD